MIKKFLIYLIINWIALSCISAQTYFSKNYPITNHWGGGSFNSIENDLGYLMLGGAISFITGNQDLVIVQTDLEGNVLFEKNYGDTTYSYFLGFQGSFQKVSDGGYVLYGGKQDENGENYDLLYRFNDLGDTLWTKQLGAVSGFIGRNVKETLDGGFICLGDGLNGGSLVYLIKTDSIGNEEWSKYIGPTQDVAYNIAVCGDGGYIFTGTTENSGNDQIRVTKVDSLGNIVFNKFFGGVEDYDGGRCVIETQDGGYAISGTYKTPTRVYPFILKLDQNGDSLWINKIVPLTIGNSNSNILRSILELGDGSLVAAGSNWYYGGSTTYHYNGLVVKLTSTGDLIWQKEYDIAETNTESSYLYDIRTTTDGGFICSGYSNQPQEMWLLKLDSLGCADTTCALATAIAAPQSPEEIFKVFPNPNIGNFTLEHNLSEQIRATLNVYNLTGEKYMNKS
ncbi:MAG: hypothetical protein H6586_07295 [Flavobacteriales bacterium]|nr:hypothetical protein [Flavobacteriales bacterium]